MTARTKRGARLALAMVLLAQLAFGQGSARPAGETPPDVAARAREHFQKGKDLYQKGSYREAIGELEAAHSLDPRAKDLVYNLAVVNEKLGQIDPAIGYVKSYLEMDLDAAERARADAYLKRLEGAKKEVEARAAAVAVSVPTPPPDKDEPEKRPPRGRIDAATITVAGVAVAGFAVGATFGLKAIADQPKNFVTGKNGSYSQLQNLEQSAHTEAIVSDISFGAGVAAAAVAAYLYFGRRKDKPPPKEGTALLAGPASDGGRGAVLWVVGSF